MTRVGVVVVNWNRAQDTLAAYRSLTSSSFEDWRLYAVDNASADNSAEILARDLADKATLILNTVNAGFSGGCNLGVHRALADGCTHIFLLNNDATVLPSTLAELVAASSKLDDTAVLGSAVKISGTDRFQFFGSRTREDVGHPDWFDDNDLGELSKGLIDTDFVLGAALFAPANIWRAIGDFDDRFYLNYEETDWCYRARKSGFRCYIVPSSIIQHQVGATVGPINGPLQTYFIYRNELLFAARHATMRQKAHLFFRSLTILIKSCLKDLIKFRTLKPPARAHAIALYDVARGKFGDCPPIIRKQATRHRTA